MKQNYVTVTLCDILNFQLIKLSARNLNCIPRPFSSFSHQIITENWFNYAFCWVVNNTIITWMQGGHNIAIEAKTKSRHEVQRPATKHASWGRGEATRETVEAKTTWKPAKNCLETPPAEAARLRCITASNTGCYGARLAASATACQTRCCCCLYCWRHQMSGTFSEKQ